MFYNQSFKVRQKTTNVLFPRNSMVLVLGIPHIFIQALSGEMFFGGNVMCNRHDKRAIRNSAKQRAGLVLATLPVPAPHQLNYLATTSQPPDLLNTCPFPGPF